MILMAMNICGILTVITINVTFTYQKNKQIMEICMSYIMNKGMYMHNCNQLFRVNEKGMNVHDYFAY